MMKKITELLKTYENQLPKVIIIDPLFRAFKGSLKVDDDVNDFIQTISHFADYCGAAVIVVHHLRKKVMGNDGKYIKQQDQDTYGSTFFGASCDTLYRLEKSYKNEDTIIVHGNMQRSGKNVKDIDIKLIQPDPLHFVVSSRHNRDMEIVKNVLINHPEGFDIEELIKRTKITRSTLYIVLKQLDEENMIMKTNTYPRKFSLRNCEE